MSGHEVHGGEYVVELDRLFSPFGLCQPLPRAREHLYGYIIEQVMICEKNDFCTR